MSFRQMLNRTIRYELGLRSAIRRQLEANVSVCPLWVACAKAYESRYLETFLWELANVLTSLIDELAIRYHEDAEGLRKAVMRIAADAHLQETFVYRFKSIEHSLEELVASYFQGNLLSTWREFALLAAVSGGWEAVLAVHAARVVVESSGVVDTVQYDLDFLAEIVSLAMESKPDEIVPTVKRELTKRCGSLLRLVGGGQCLRKK